MSNGPEKLPPRNDPARRCLKLRDWPEPDRLAWEAAIAHCESGLASHWRPNTRKGVLDAYGRWLTFLERNGWIEPNASPGQRLTPDRLVAYVAELQGMVAPKTLRNRITNLTEALRVMAPESDFPYLRLARAHVNACAKPDRVPSPSKDPARCCLKFQKWPTPDQEAWEAAIAQGGLLDECGLASRWRASTRKTVQDAYGRWLTFLERNGWVETNASPGQRLTPDRLRAFVAELQETVAPNTLRNRITNLAEALRVMAPEFDFPYLRRARARLKARARPVRNKRAQMAPSRELLQLGLELTQRAEREDGADELVRAALYRDGLMIMMLTCRPIRRRNFAELRLGLHLVRRGEAYVIFLEGSETKNHRRFEQALPSALTPFIERYLEQYRPQLLGGAQFDHVWISRRRRPMPDTGIYDAVRKRTKVAFGTGIPPHRFRDSAVTSMGEKDPELVWLAPALLHHADRRVAEIHYNQARDAGAVDLWQGYVQAERRAAKNKTHRRTRGRPRPTRTYV